MNRNKKIYKPASIAVVISVLLLATSPLTGRPANKIDDTFARDRYLVFLRSV